MITFLLTQILYSKAVAYVPSEKWILKTAQEGRDIPKAMYLKYRVETDSGESFLDEFVLLSSGSILYTGKKKNVAELPDLGFAWIAGAIDGTRGISAEKISQLLEANEAKPLKTTLTRLDRNPCWEIRAGDNAVCFLKVSGSLVRLLKSGKEIQFKDYTSDVAAVRLPREVDLLENGKIKFKCFLVDHKTGQPKALEAMIKPASKTESQEDYEHYVR